MLRRGRAAVGGLALRRDRRVSPRVRGVGATSPARPRDVVTVHIRDNVFAPANLDVEPGTTVRWVNEGRNRHNVTPEPGARSAAANLKPGKSYVRTFADAGRVRVLLHAPRHADERPARRARGRRRRGRRPGAVGRWRATRRADVRGVGPHDPRARATRRRSRPASTSAKPGDLVLVSPGVYQEAVTVATDGIVIRGVDRNSTILDGEFKRDNGVNVVGADGVAVENLTARNYTENGFFWTGVLGYRGLVPHRVPQRRLRHLRVRLAVRAVRPLVRVGQPRLRLLHRPVQSVPRGHHRRRVRVQPARLLGHELGGDLFIVNSVWRDNRTGIVPNSLDGRGARRRRATATIAGNVVDDNGSADAAIGRRGASTSRFGVGIVIVGRDRRTSSRRTASTATPRSWASRSRPSPGSAGSVLRRRPATRCTDNMVQGSGLADLARSSRARRRRQLLRRQHVHHVGARRTSSR